jgi:predicted TIM-barrel fold metal-dependent hydrolase
MLLGGDARAVLEAEIKAGNGRFRGIRHSSAWDADPNVAGMYASRPKNLLQDEIFHKGFACLGPLGLTFDAWLFHPQIPELTALARKFPNQKIILDHCGGFIGIGSYKAKREENFAQWKASIKELAKCDNVVVKLGGLAMSLPGFGFETRPRPPSSEELARAWKPHIDVCIDAFGPKRGMFESNFPPDKGSCSYQVLWNTFKRLAAGFSEEEKTWLFSRTAAETYKLKLS